MNVAVITVTRDRLDYTRHCFATLRARAGCDFDHYVYDNGSADGTRDWLDAEFKAGRLQGVAFSPGNIGVSRAINHLLDYFVTGHDYAAIVKVDNDCELVSHDALAAACTAVVARPTWILSPRILGLNSPPMVEAETVVHGLRVGQVGMLGGIFMAAPADVYGAHGYRHDPGNPVWGMDDVRLWSWWSQRGGRLGYMLDHEANHYETTEGQKERYPSYWERKKAEMGL